MSVLISVSPYCRSLFATVPSPRGFSPAASKVLFTPHRINTHVGPFSEILQLYCGTRSHYAPTLQLRLTYCSISHDCDVPNQFHKPDINAQTPRRPYLLSNARVPADVVRHPQLQVAHAGDGVQHPAGLRGVEGVQVDLHPAVHQRPQGYRLRPHLLLNRKRAWL